MKTTKILLALLLFLCLANMPYGYYQLVRFISFVCFSIFAFDANRQKMETNFIIYTVLAILFQPFFKIALGRELWNIIDVIVGLYLLATITEKGKDT